MLKDKHGWWLGPQMPDIKNISFNNEIISCTKLITAQG